MKRHLKRLAAPKTWNIGRKETKFIARPATSGHSMELSISLNVFMKEMTGFAKTTKEVKAILQNKKLLVDGRRRKDHRFAVGFLDAIELEELGEAYRMSIDKKGQLISIPISVKEAGTKVCKIIKKTVTKGKRMQINLNDGKNLFIDGKENYKVTDSLVLDVKNNKIVDHLPFGKNMTVLLLQGKNKGLLGKITDIQERGMVIVKTNDGKEYTATKESCFVVGKAQAAITVQKQE